MIFSTLDVFQKNALVELHKRLYPDLKPYGFLNVDKGVFFGEKMERFGKKGDKIKENIEYVILSVRIYATFLLNDEKYDIMYQWREIFFLRMIS